MSVIFPILLVVIILACAGTLFNEGMWGNALNLINVILAGLMAFNFFEPMARWIESWGGWFDKNAAYLDFLSLWIIFCISLIVFRLASNAISRVKVRFLMIVDRAGSAVFALLVGWVLVCFTTASLHTAPLAEKFMWGGFDQNKRMLFGLAPDRQWLGLMKLASRAGFSRGQEFDPNSDFPARYGAVRSAVESGGSIPSRSGGQE
jgi:hypothetical protein